MWKIWQITSSKRMEGNASAYVRCQVPGASQGLGEKYVTCSGNRNCMERDYTVASPLPRFEVIDKKGDS